MSITPTPTFKDTTNTTGGLTTTQALANILLPVLVVVGVFILIAIGKLDSATGIPLISVIVGVHGGAAITNYAKT